MSSRSEITQYPVITNGDMSADVTSRVTILKGLSVVSYGISWTGAPVGDFSVEVSNDYQLDAGGNVKNAGTWTPLTLSSSASAAGSADHGFIDVRITGAYAIRLVYTRTSGTGVLNAYLNGKVA